MARTLFSTREASVHTVQRSVFNLSLSSGVVRASGSFARRVPLARAGRHFRPASVITRPASGHTP
eukprot:15176242-Alexandrium_andersonii.AAC.1